MATETGSLERKISRGVIAIYKDYTGRGPERARTTISNACSSTIVEGSLTKAEVRLVERGEGGTVRGMRRKVQEVMADELLELVREASGREVSRLLSDHHPEGDVAVETIIFADAESSD